MMHLLRNLAVSKVWPRRGSGLRSELVGAGALSLGVRVGSIALSAAVTVVLARQLGPHQFGTYATAITAITLLTIPISAGVLTLLVRNVAGYVASKDWGLAKGLIIRANHVAMLYALCVGMVGAVAVRVVMGRQVGYSELGQLLLLLVFYSLSFVRSGTIRGFKRSVAGQLPDAIIRPVALLAFAAALAHGSDGSEISLSSAIWATVAAAGVAFAFGVHVQKNVTPEQVEAARARYEDQRWLKSTLPLTLIAGVQVLDGNADTALLSLLGTQADVGVYRVSLQIAALVSLGLIAVNYIVAPYVASLHRSGDKDTLQRVVDGTTASGLAFAICAFLGVLVAGKPLIALVFGHEYRAAYVPAVILSAGYVILVRNGAVLTVATMLNLERSAVAALTWGVVANLALGILLIPHYGMVGAALSTTAGTVIWRQLLVRKVYHATGIRTVYSLRILLVRILRTMRKTPTWALKKHA